MPTLALLDGHSLAYRAFYALPADLATATGQVTNAAYGFTSMLIKLLGDEHPDAIAVAWDLRGPTFRSERYPEYKAQRESPPDLFRSQLPLIREVLDSLRITQVGVPGFEADDVIATLATQAQTEGWNVIIVTGDRDAFQLVTDGITVLYTRRGISDTIAADAVYVEERYGVRPDQYLDYAALRGDTSDNLPGVPGVGEKTAAKLIGGYGDLNGLYEHLDEMTPKLRENLENNREQAMLNRELMDLVRDVQFPDTDSGRISIDGLTISQWDEGEVKQVFDGLAFRSLWERLQELGGGAAVERDSIDVEVDTVVTAAAIEELIDAGGVAVEPVYDAGILVGLMLAAPHGGSFVPVDHFGALDAAFTKTGATIMAHDAKPLLRLLVDHEVAPPGVVFDTALAAYLINPSLRTPDLEDLASEELGLLVTPSADEAAAESQGAFDFSGESGPDLVGAARRAVAVRMLVEPLREQIDVRGGLSLYEEIELPLIPVLTRMEVTGIRIDQDLLQRFSDDLRKRLSELETQVYEAAGEPFNVGSPKQLGEVLYERLGLPVLKKTRTGAASTDAKVLAKLRDEHPVVDLLLQWRELDKLRGTYVDALIPMVDDDGRLRGRFNQMAAATGRLSQEEPNLQNIPVRSEEGRAIRRIFIADEGWTLLVADYSQIELRILAHLSGDSGLVSAFTGDEDVHAATAARINGVPLSEVNPDMRRRAKMINFGLLYGMEAYGLADRLGISKAEAAEHIDAYFSQFPDVRAFLKGIVAEATASGYTQTLLGRRRYLPELASGNFRIRQSGERMALNAPIQGSAADIIKKAMVHLERRLRRDGYRSEQLLQIHDELVIEVPEEELEAVTSLTREMMEGIISLDVPLKVDTASGKTLADCKS
jgi:DNA polymerase-1